MGKFCDQGDKSMDVGVKAPTYGHGMQGVIKEAQGKTTGIVGMKGIGKNGVPIKGGK